MVSGGIARGSSNITARKALHAHRATLEGTVAT